MTDRLWPRRDFTKTILAGLPLLSLDWDAFPRGAARDRGDDVYDAVIIGAGLGGLSCAAAFARQGFKPLVVEQHIKPGGYATTFARPGGFVFDVSLHSTSVPERGGLVDTRLTDPRLKAIVSWLWGYYGLPPSKLSCFYYALPTIGYLTNGGYYPRGRSQAISNALVRFIEARGGQVLLGTRVEGVVTEEHAAVGVRTGDGTIFRGRVVVSNVYGWDQTLDNSGSNRLPYATPIKGLYLAGAWTSPGGGYGAVIPSGLACFAEIMKGW